MPDEEAGLTDPRGTRNRGTERRGIGPVPAPYPNLGKASDTDGGGKKVKVQGAARRAGEADTEFGGGHVGKAEFQASSFDVKVEGVNAADKLRRLR